MKRQGLPNTVRRSVALPRHLVEEVIATAPEGLRHNLNRLVTVALQEFVARRRERAFEDAMSRMAADQAVCAESTMISREFLAAEADGLPG